MKRALPFFCGMLFLAFPANLKAADTGVQGTNLEFFRPAIDPFGFFGVNGPRLLPAGVPYFRIGQGLSGGGLFSVAVNNVPVALVERVATTHFLASLGLTDFLTISLDLPAHFYAREADFNTLASFTTRSLGDLRMAMKIKVLGERKRLPGLALLVTNSFPTGNERKFLGTSHVVPGFDLIVGKDFGYFRVAANVGARFPEQKNILGVNFDDQVAYGAAAQVPLSFWDRFLSLAGEIRGHFEPNEIQINTAPIEFTLGLEKKFQNGLALLAGGGGAWNNAIGNPRYRGIFSIGYSPPGRREAKEKTREASEKIRTTVYFQTGAVRPTEESSRWVKEVARLLESSKTEQILVEGHTDTRGRDDYNLRLSQKRAEAVKEMLVREGIDPKRIEATGVDGDKPAAVNTTPAGRRLNRRVEIMGRL